MKNTRVFAINHPEVALCSSQYEWLLVIRLGFQTVLSKGSCSFSKQDFWPKIVVLLHEREGEASHRGGSTMSQQFQENFIQCTPSTDLLLLSTILEKEN